jgi:pimeloyl-ACP methyl ester carboxylesterase
MPMALLPGVLLHHVVLKPRHGASAPADVVLVHGLGANLAVWFWTLGPALAANNRVLMFDLRGHGLSSMPRGGYTVQIMAEDLRELLDAVGVTAAHLLGHSFGGRVLIQFASRYPDRVKSLTFADVLLNSIQPWATPSRWASWPDLRAVLARAGVSVRLDGREPTIALMEALARLRLSLRGFAGGSDAAVPSPFMGGAGRRSAMQWLRLLEQTTARDDLAQSSDPTLEQLAQLRKPTLLVYGEHSHALTTANALKRLWPHARAETVCQSGHFFPISSPERLLAPVGQFLSEQARC